MVPATDAGPTPKLQPKPRLKSKGKAAKNTAAAPDQGDTDTMNINMDNLAMGKADANVDAQREQHTKTKLCIACERSASQQVF